MCSEEPRLFSPPEGFKRLFLVVAWDGEPFVGWQSQQNAVSVQDTLQEALLKLGAQGAFRSVAAGRTDAGVHAEAMPIHWDVPEGFSFPPERLARALNAHLPTSISILRAEHAPVGLHARFSCVERHYVYRMWLGAERHPLWEGRALQLFGAFGRLDVGAMQAAAELLLGTHDFAAFATKEDRTTVRELLGVELKSIPQTGGELLELHIRGESFLRHMIRGLVGTLILVGQGKLPVQEVQNILASRQRAKAGSNVSPCGLYFVGAKYRQESVFIVEG